MSSITAQVLRGLDRWFVLVALGASLGLNVYLASGRLSRDSVHLPPNLKGSRLSELKVKALNGNEMRLEWRTDKRPTLIYIFSPQCAWCARNLENIKALRAARGSQYRFVGLSLLDSGLADYVSRNGLRFETYSSPRRSDGRKFGSMTPETLIVDPSGIIRHDWQGAYTPEALKEIESVMDVKLPGLTDSNKTDSTSGVKGAF